MKKNSNNTKYRYGGVFLNGLLIFAIFFAGAIFFNQKFNQKTVCEKQLEYSIGKIDARFNISRGDFLNIAKEATAVWEKGTGMNLFKYNPQSDFKVNLIFDTRQQNTISERNSKESLNKSNSLYKKLTEKYNTLKILHNKLFNQYEKDVISYNYNLKKHNKEVKYWNDKGGAPEIEFQKLEQERSVLKGSRLELNKKTDALNLFNKKMNETADQMNKFVKTMNTNISTYNNKFGKANIFDEGEYTGSSINIYQFDNTKDLRVVLAHEFGHALNLNHVQNPKSIMYYLMGKQNINSPSLTTEDIDALKTECKIK